MRQVRIFEFEGVALHIEVFEASKMYEILAR